jgi:hypothetical protein
MYNVTLWRVRATIAVVEKQCALHSLSVCICSLRYPACCVQAPFHHLWPALLYSTFTPYLINSMIFEKVAEHKICFDFLYNTCLKHFSF